MKIFVSRLDAALDVIATLQRERRALRQELRNAREHFGWISRNSQFRIKVESSSRRMIARIDKVLKSKRKVKAK